MGVNEKVRESGLILGALGVIGFIGIVWLMIFGNLDGNLGFGQDTATILNETIASVDETPGVQLDIGALINPICTINTVQNATSGTIIPSDNFTTSGLGGCTLSYIGDGNTGGFNTSNWNVSYSRSFDGTGKINTDGVINNLTGGFNTFFGFSNTFFTIAAIVLLIFMLVGLLAIVMSIAEGKKNKSSGFAGN